MEKDKWILVTGAAGFIGSNLLKGLEENNYNNVVAVDWLGSGDKWRNVAKRKNVKLWLSPDDILTRLPGLAPNLGAVVHLGAISSTTEKNVDRLMESNYRLTLEYANCCREYGIPLIYASSAAVYGAGDTFSDSSDWRDIAALQPLNPYGFSKKMADLALAREGAFSQHPIVGLRFFNVYGPNEYHKGSQASVVGHFRSQTLSGSIRLFESNTRRVKNGEQRRDFVHVADCVKVILWFLEHPECRGIYNVGTGRARSFNAMASAVAKAMRCQANIEYIPMPEEIKDQYQNYTCAELNRLRLAGCDVKFRSLEKGVAEYIKVLNNNDIYI